MGSYKKVFSLIVLFLIVTILSGCIIRTKKTKLHEYQKISTNDRLTYIIYEVESKPSRITDNQLFWDINNVIFEFNFGLQKYRLDYNNEKVFKDAYCYAVYFYWPTESSLDDDDPYTYKHKDFSDYKNAPDTIFLKEISTEEFLSELFLCQHGDSNIFTSKPPVYNKDLLPFEAKVPQELFLKSEAKGIDRNNNYKFFFGVTPVYLDTETGLYNFGEIGFGGEYDGLKFYYKYDSKTEVSFRVEAGNGMTY